MVTTPVGEVFEYHVHGTGYTFTHLQSRKEMHFDVTRVDGIQNIRFSVWAVCRYAQSIGINVSEMPAAAEELRMLIADLPDIVNVREGFFDYYLTEGLPPVESGSTNWNETQP